jgi:hypothetical protein
VPAAAVLFIIAEGTSRSESNTCDVNLKRLRSYRCHSSNKRNEAFGLAPGGAALHVGDLPVAEGEDLEALLPPTVGTEQVVADDLVSPTA